MRKINALIWIIVISFCSIARADSWQGYELWNSNESVSIPSLAVIYQGQSYSPPKEITVMSKEIDRSSPTALLKSLFWAANQLDGEVFNKLFVSGELKQPFANDPNFKLTKLALRRIMRYGNYSILELEVTFPKKSSVLLWPVRKIGDEYFATEALLATDKAYDFINYYYAYAVSLGVPNDQELKKINLSENGYLYMTNFTYENTNFLPPLIFRFQGQDFGTNTFIDRWPMKDEQNLSSPTGTLAAAIAALNEENVERYSQLLDPQERTNILHYGSDLAVGHTWEEWMRMNFAKETQYYRPEKIRLDLEIKYAPDAVALIYEDAANKPDIQKDILYFHKNGMKWFISHKIEESGNPLPTYLGFGTWMATKMFPHFHSIKKN